MYYNLFNQHLDPLTNHKKDKLIFISFINLIPKIFNMNLLQLILIFTYNVIYQYYLNTSLINI